MIYPAQHLREINLFYGFFIDFITNEFYKNTLLVQKAFILVFLWTG